jgi:hypothetical protein
VPAALGARPKDISHRRVSLPALTGEVATRVSFLARSGARSRIKERQA